MPQGFEVTEYNLSVIPEIKVDEWSFPLDRTGFILGEVVQFTDGAGVSGFLNPRTQVALSFQQASMVLADRSGYGPTRPEFISCARQFFDVLNDQDVGVGAYGWNIEGFFNGVSLNAAYTRLFDDPEVAELLALDDEAPRFARRIELVADSEVADRIGFVLKIDLIDGVGRLGFAINEHFDSPFSVQAMEEQGGEFGDRSLEVLERFLAKLEHREESEDV